MEKEEAQQQQQEVATGTGARDPWFVVVHEAASAVGPRLGRATVKPGRGEVATPGWLPATRKGCVPHLTPDLLARVPHLDALQLPLQDLYAPSPSPPPTTT
jgi:queuine tRNA-ribosyltransferase